MSTAGDGEDEQFGGDESKKSERKRQRERQRRFDLANAFEELASLLSEIEPEESDTAPHHRRRRRRSGVDTSELDQSENPGMTRLDLIGRSVEALRRLHRENKELKRVVEQQREGRDEKEVLVMVPTLTSVDQDHGVGHAVGARASYPPPYYPQPQHGHHPLPPPLPPPSQQQQQMHDYRGPPPPGVSYYSGPMHAAYSYGGQNWGPPGPPPPQHMQQPSPPPASQYHSPLPQQPPHYEQGSPRKAKSPTKRDSG